ncbi:hypothetical protein BZG36_03820 [Bifiguratus adelaidae]|uniref:Vacuolar protein-sorting-associated protein 25 n=1 Tax=Bifiguratus adelaidae TaxID=1938954 RepID=A0A261XZN4_9FUNG|nr:hypothetical protein BZG36_03820 [Bifiguratus adelaidae]
MTDTQSTKTVTTPTGFSFPSIYNFPPFFTPQPTPSTWQSQVSMWQSLILAYYKHHKIYRLNVTEAITGQDSLLSPLFSNTAIKRRLDGDALSRILDEMVRQGNAEWDTTSSSASNLNRLATLPSAISKPSSPKTTALIYWRKPDEWATLISQWINDHGLNNAIMTTYELIHGDTTEDAEFHGLDMAILLKALDILSKRGVAQMFVGSQPENTGVKFFGVT